MIKALISLFYRYISFSNVCTHTDLPLISIFLLVNVTLPPFFSEKLVIRYVCFTRINWLLPVWGISLKREYRIPMFVSCFL